MLSLYRLPGMMPGEKIIKIVRRSFFVFFKKILFFIISCVVLAAFISITLANFPDILADQAYYPVFVLGVSAFCLFIWLFFFFSFIDYYLDIFFITTERIISIRQEGFFSRVISEQKNEMVQDVTSEVHGVFQTILRYGNIHVQTAGEVKRIFFKEISDPEGVRDTIIKLIEDCRRRKHAVL